MDVSGAMARIFAERDAGKVAARAAKANSRRLTLDLGQVLPALFFREGAENAEEEEEESAASRIAPEEVAKLSMGEMVDTKAVNVEISEQSEDTNDASPSAVVAKSMEEEEEEEEKCLFSSD